MGRGEDFYSADVVTFLNRKIYGDSQVWRGKR